MGNGAPVPNSREWSSGRDPRMPCELTKGSPSEETRLRGGWNAATKELGLGEGGRKEGGENRLISDERRQGRGV